MIIRPLQAEDNAAIEAVIRDCLIEFGGNREGLAWIDESLSALSRYYEPEGRAYWVVEQDGRVLGGAGIAPFADSSEVCELQKMYLRQEIRGTGIAAQLLATCLDFAKRHYKQCYLETLQTMEAANRFYRKHGFRKLEVPLAGSEHFACDAWYMMDLHS
ncbi:GNAT family N-acetyltransferase [Paenibacillus sp. MB22_1]|uniref:GNAT family N-acetyltransferase n=1 Tax=Paenibacillus TaxID=44249 RepID=UPI0021A927AB|nr:GNAT family N-acetyltransferase [Paenibacillus sp. p3-SID1389]MCT2194043.1 GNAT family N-acetyltransferase [Paenibacillus sp. p3-SID1389]